MATPPLAQPPDASQVLTEADHAFRRTIFSNVFLWIIVKPVHLLFTRLLPAILLLVLHLLRWVLLWLLAVLNFFLQPLILPVKVLVWRPVVLITSALYHSRHVIYFFSFALVIGSILGLLSSYLVRAAGSSSSSTQPKSHERTTEARSSRGQRLSAKAATGAHAEQDPRPAHPRTGEPLHRRPSRSTTFPTNVPGRTTVKNESDAETASESEGEEIGRTSTRMGATSMRPSDAGKGPSSLFADSPLHRRSSEFEDRPDQDRYKRALSALAQRRRSLQEVR